MARKRKDNISEVTFSYIGTDAQFDEFLKMLVHDYLSVDQPYTKLQEDFVDHVDSCCARWIVLAIRKQCAMVCAAISTHHSGKEEP